MAGTLFENNLSPYLTIVETAAASVGTPSSGDQRVFIDTDHLLKYKNSSGTVSAVSTGITNPMTTKGDIILGDTSGVPSRLAAGTSTFVLTSNGAGAFPSWQAGGGGGGSDLVQTNSGAGSIYVPGLRGSPDAKPASPNAKDDEFEALSGWTTLGALDVSNVTDFPSHWHGQRACSSDINGLYKAIPSMPFTVTMHLVGSNLFAGTAHPSIGFMLLDSTPTAIREFSYNAASGTTFSQSLRRYTNRTTFATSVDVALGVPGTALPVTMFTSIYLQLLVTSSSSVTFRHSFDGRIWYTPASLSAISPTLTPAFVGICLSDPVSASSPEAVIDWIRFS